jgi:hypothetical protein
MMGSSGMDSFNRGLSVLKMSGFLLLILSSIPLLFSCSRDDKGVSAEVCSAPQKCSGTLPVRIVPESPTAAEDIQAVFNTMSGVSYSWEKNGVLLEGADTPRLSRNLFSKHDTITVIVRKGSEKGSASVVIRNALPKVTSVSLTPVDIHRGVDITAVPVAVDPDGDTVSFNAKWSLNGKELPDNTLVLKGDMIKKGDLVSLSVIPSDNEGAGPVFKTATLKIPNAIPYFVTLPPPSFESNLYTYHATAVDPDGDTVSYGLVEPPKGMVVDSKSGAVTWNVPPGVTGLHEIQIVARDADGAQVIQKYSLNLN